MHDLTGFQRDILYVLGGLDDPKGLAVKDELDSYYSGDINHGRLYPNLDALVEKGLVEKGRIDDVRAARRGEYHASETNDLEAQLEPLARNDRYVARDGDAYRVTDEVQELVSFRKHDLVQEDPPRAFDLVICRNLFIYINKGAKEAIFETLSSAVEPGGYLTIGMTETVPGSCRDRFDPVEKRLRIYRDSTRGDDGGAGSRSSRSDSGSGSSATGSRSRSDAKSGSGPESASRSTSER